MIPIHYGAILKHYLGDAEYIKKHFGKAAPWGTRVYPLVCPVTNAPEYPFIVYRATGPTPTDTKDGIMEGNLHIELTIVHRNYDALVETAEMAYRVVEQESTMILSDVLTWHLLVLELGEISFGSDGYDPAADHYYIALNFDASISGTEWDEREL